ncbi:hypothetical protein [Roseibium sp.]|uniref:hypothetical protein n=1 Tax=Roseibium sp. TaxID=1936156 RepID=UPI003B52B7D6
MTRASAIQRLDAQKIAPPAAHRAGLMAETTAPLITEIAKLQTDLERCLDKRPHDKTEILRLVENLKKRAMTLHGQAVAAFQNIRSGR